MISVLADGESCYRLQDPTGADVGWIRGRAIGFHGPWSEAQAIAAAAAGWPTFQCMLQRTFAGWPKPAVALDRLRVVHDGAYEWVSDGRVPVARLDRATSSAAAFEFVRDAEPADTHGADDAADTIRLGAGRLAIQFVLPTFASEGVAISIAQVLGNALAPHLASHAGTTLAADGVVAAPMSRTRVASLTTAGAGSDVAASA
jgi:hypothetical protein